MPLRARLAQILAGFLVLASGYSSISYFLETFTYGKVDFDHVADWESRFAPVKEALPIQRGALGYISDWDVPGIEFDPSDQDAEYILTQYTFSPFILVRGTDHEWIVGSLSAAAYEKWLEVREGEYEDLKFKGNIYLFHRLK